MERHGSIDERTDQHDGDTNSNYLFKLATNSNGRCSDKNQVENEHNETIYHSGINANEGDVSCYCDPGNYYCYGLQSSLIFPRKYFTFRGRYVTLVQANSVHCQIAPMVQQQPHDRIALANAHKIFIQTIVDIDVTPHNLPTEAIEVIGNENIQLTNHSISCKSKPLCEGKETQSPKPSQSILSEQTFVWEGTCIEVRR